MRSSGEQVLLSGSRTTHKKPAKRVQLTRVEKLERDYPGLQLYVDTSFDRGISGAEISRGLKKKFNVTIPERVLYSYRRKRWVPTWEKFQEGLRRVRFVSRVMDEIPEKNARRALIYEQLFHMSLEDLRDRDVEATGLESQDRKLDIEDKRTDNQEKALRAKLQEAKAAPGRADKAPHPATRAKDEDELRKKIDEIYGIGRAAPSAPPVSGQVGR